MYRGGFVWEVDFSHMFIVQAIQGSQAQAFLSLHALIRAVREGRNQLRESKTAFEIVAIL